MSRGLFIAKDGKSVGRRRNRFDSGNPHLQINLLKKPLHMDILTLTGGTALSLASPGSEEEMLDEFEHGLPYTPEVMNFFYVASYGGSPTDPKAGTYSSDRIIYSGSSGTVADAIYLEVNEKYVRIMHRLELFFGGPYTSDADEYTIRLKYYILSNDSHVAEYNTRGY